MAMVFQDYALYPQMTVAENLGFALKMRGMPSAEIAARVRKVASMMEMDGLLDRRPKALSGGQRQRVALGRALIRDPSVFLFDEPLSNLDAKLRVGMRMEIRKLQLSLGTTAIYVTHDQIEAMTMADRIVVMRGGAVQQIGSPMELYLRPANSFVATFIGSPPMSLVEAPVQWSGKMAALSFAGHGPLPLPPEQSRALAAAGVDRVVAGLRAEHVLVDPDGPFVSDVVLVEDHGAESVAVLSLGGREVMARVRPGTVRVGDRGLRFGLDTAGMRLFHPVDDHALV
jgi:ABC-type sugar transport system ATPase subunit